MAAPSAASLQTIQQQIAANPQIAQALLADAKKLPNTGKGAVGLQANPAAYQQGQAAILKSFGIDIPHDYYVGFNKATGAPTVQEESWFARNGDWAVPALVFGGGAAVGLLGGGAAAAGSGVGSGTTAGGTAAAGGSAAGGVGTGAAVGSSLWKTIATAAIPAAANLAGAKVESSANDKAAQITADQADRALAQTKEIYDTNRNDLAPYRQEGVSSLAALNSHLGLPAPTQMPSAPTQTLASLGQQSATTTGPEPMVNMLSPQGQPGQVPQSKVQQALAAGGKLVTQ